MAMQEWVAQRRKQGAAERKQRKILGKIGYSEPHKLTDTLQGKNISTFRAGSIANYE